MPTEKNEFIFTESEFEDDNFLAASFVSKYRRVTSTESLKDELLIYSNALKQQLYDIINRDYKDFITISTKLDGVDERVAILKKPLKELQTNMSILHEGVLSSMQALQDKIRDRAEVSNRKTMVTTLLGCIEQVEVIHRVLHHANVTSTVSTASNVPSSSCKREKLLKLLDRKLANSNNATNSSSSSSANMLKRDIFICSEYERAAYCLQSLRNNIITITPLVGNSNNPGVEKLFSQLKAQCSELTVILVDKIKSKLSHILSGVMLTSLSASTETIVSSNTDEKVDYSVSFSHCIRALLVLSKGEVAESVVRVDLIDPYVKQFLTAGRIDGKGGRGSYLGLQQALESIVTAITESQLKTYLDVTEELLSLQTSDNSIDILTHGVYSPILNVLSERCANMYSIAIANTLSACYTSITAFHNQFFKIVDPVYCVAARNRIMRSRCFIDFHKKWKLDMYYSLRYNEIANRVDKICDVVPTTKSTNQQNLLMLYGKTLVDHIYDTPPPSSALPPLPTNRETPVKPGAPSPAPPIIAPVLIPLTMTLSTAEYDELKTLLLTSYPYHYSLFTLFSIELLTAVHDKVALDPLVHKFVAFVLKINLRLENHVRALCEVTHSNGAEGSHDIPSTPTKKTVSSVSLSQSPVTSVGNLSAMGTSVPNASASNPSTFGIHLSLDELVFMVHDLFNYTTWINNSLKLKILSLLITSSNMNHKESVETKSCPPLDKSFSIISDQLLHTRQAIFSRLASILTNDCKQPIAGAVKAIAGKYRMTNKPPPDTHSQYVEQILQPLRQFVGNHDKILAQLFADQHNIVPYSFMVQVVNDVTVHFLEQERLLIDSVKQQDSTLMRRTKLATTKTGTLSDTEKIILQLQLDVKSFGNEIVSVCKISPSQLIGIVPSFATLTDEVNEANSKLQATASVAEK